METIMTHNVDRLEIMTHNVDRPEIITHNVDSPNIVTHNADRRGILTHYCDAVWVVDITMYFPANADATIEAEHNYVFENRYWENPPAPKVRE